MGLLYNSTGDKACIDQGDLVGPASPGDTWLFQWCTQRAGQELPYYPANGRSDMFWDQGMPGLIWRMHASCYRRHHVLIPGWLRPAGEYSEEMIRRECMDRFNVTGSGDWPIISLGGLDGFEYTTNIVFSNGGGLSLVQGTAWAGGSCP